MKDRASLYSRLAGGQFIIAGPCVIESRDHALRHARALRDIVTRHGFEFVFKSSYDKANRTSISSVRGPGIDGGLQILADVRSELDVPVLTDVHDVDQARQAAESVEIVQIPAFLSRQTDLVVAAAHTGAIVNIKKAQFMAPADIRYPCEKAASTGNAKILVTERGTMHGYGDLIVDLRGLIDMRAFGYPIVMDCTHAAQKPGQHGGRSGGNRLYAPYYALAAATTGVTGFFFEVHEDPDNAPSDGPNMLRLDEFEAVVRKLVKIIEAARDAA